MACEVKIRSPAPQPRLPPLRNPRNPNNPNLLPHHRLRSAKTRRPRLPHLPNQPPPPRLPASHPPQISPQIRLINNSSSRNPLRHGRISYVRIATVRFRTPSVTKSPQARLNQ